ncbi:MAG: hypothetical protein KF819_10920 [Labilithrix sp.]|nr:hypothetical protein [Labilithrix sp.]
MSRRLIIGVALGLTLIARPTIAYAEDDAARPPEEGGDEVVELSSGDRYRGALIERVVGDHVTIRLATGDIKRFSWSEVRSVGAAAASTPAPADSDETPLTPRTDSKPLPERGRGQRLGGGITLATGGALVIAGGVLAALGARHSREDLEQCKPRCLESDIDAVRQADTFTNVGVPMLVTGAVASIVGFVLLLTAPSASKSVPTGASWMPSLTTGTF